MSNLLCLSALTLNQEYKVFEFWSWIKFQSTKERVIGIHTYLAALNCGCWNNKLLIWKNRKAEIHANWAKKDQAEDKGHNKMQITNTKLGPFLHSKFRLRSRVLESLHNSLNQILVSFISGVNIFHNLG